ncbi:MAG: SRPBCC domain-containing protein [Candidatus Sphingomonas phytovorans]|nr:SRPBCC domain-containing protein [Sphingomonas sp.]WEK00641.1 MAG: SRPBCC domain-containing protein [Sphingomonas sp.]
MTQKAETIEPLRLSRIYPAPRALVFEAWSSAEHVKQWFSPETFTVPEATVEMRVGGTFDFCMRGPDGTDYWNRGTVAEVRPNERLVLDLRAEGGSGNVLFTARTEVDFMDDAGGTRIDIVQSYVFVDLTLAPMMVQGAPIGWSQTLDKLGVELARMTAA